MYTVYEIDYNGRCFQVSKADTIQEAIKIEKAALRRSHSEFPTFTTDGWKTYTCNGKPV